MHNSCAELKPMHLPVEGPLEEKLPCRLGKFMSPSLIGFQYCVYYPFQPGCPLFQSVLLLKSGLEIVLKPNNKRLVALTHPRGLFLEDV